MVGFILLLVNFSVAARWDINHVRYIDSGDSIEIVYRSLGVITPGELVARELEVISGDDTVDETFLADLKNYKVYVIFPHDSTCNVVDSLVEDWFFFSNYQLNTGQLIGMELDSTGECKRKTIRKWCKYDVKLNFVNPYGDTINYTGYVWVTPITGKSKKFSITFGDHSYSLFFLWAYPLEKENVLAEDGVMSIRKALIDRRLMLGDFELWGYSPDGRLLVHSYSLKSSDIFKQYHLDDFLKPFNCIEKAGGDENRDE